MNKTAAVKHFGTKYAVAKALGIHRSAVGRWGRKVPLRQAIRLNLITRDALQLNLRDYQ